jgi:hypothetical protein
LKNTFYFQNDVLKLQEDFSEHGIRVFLKSGLGSIFLFYRFETNQRGLKVPKTRLKTKETTYTLVFVENLVGSCQSLSIRAFSVFLEDSLRIISGT